MTQYVPLHVHTEYSLLDGATKIGDLLKVAKEKDMPAVAITDHGVMYGAIELYKKAKEAGIKPIVGCEFYVHNNDLSHKDSSDNPLYHLVLLAKNVQGYKNLMKLVSIAQVEGYYYKPRINFEVLQKHAEGLVCLSACLGGELQQLILRDKKDEAIETAKKYKDLFGKDYYIELQDHGIDRQKIVNPVLIEIAKKLNIEMVITNDSHYTKKDDADFHDVLICLQTNRLKNDEHRMRFTPFGEYYVKTPGELREKFDWLDEETFNRAIENTVKIADGCHLTIELGKSVLPNFEVPANHTNASYLDYLVMEGLKKRYGEITPELKERTRYELGVIEKMGYSAYFLIVWDFINYAKKNHIPVGPGRGSAAGSVVAYALGITDLDPIEHKLLFERFLNPERISMPDVDIDFCPIRRQEVIDYVTHKYGEDKVCQIITFSTLAARNAVKGVARVLDLPFAESNKISKLIPFGCSVKDSFEQSPEFKTLYESDATVKQVVDYAEQVEGLKCGTGVHAAGVIISRDPLSEVIPVQNSKEGGLTTAFPMSDVESLGLLKMDFLGLRNLTVINKTVELIKLRKGVELEINKIPLDDSKTYELLCKGDTDGVFQLESSGMKNLVKRLKPSTFDDIGSLVALFRPGPLNSGMVDEFVDRKHGRRQVVYPHPMLEAILKDTYGTIVYQEQIMQIFQTLAGYSLGQADMVRRMMGKKKIAEMAKQKEKFIEGAAKNNMSAKDATELFEQIEKFAEYCFNRAHSACYAFVAYQTAYLKAHYPVEYFSALLSSVNGDQERTQIYIAEANKLGIKVLPPDVNSSFADFTPDGDNIRFGLASIKNVGLNIVEEIISAREEEPYSSFYDFCTKLVKTNLNKRVLESLIKAGAFAQIEKSRKQLVENIDSAISAAQREQERKESGQINLFAALSQDEGGADFVLTGSDEEFGDRDIQAFEKELLGFYVTSHPLSKLVQYMPYLTTHATSDLNELNEKTYVTVCGLITSLRLILTKTNKQLKVGVLEDLNGKVEFVAYQEVLNKYNSLLELDQTVVLAGKIQYRGDDEEKIVSIVVDEVRAAKNCNIVNLFFKSRQSFENIMLLKDLLVEHKGNDPLVFNVKNGDEDLKILANSNFWVSASNDMKNVIKAKFKDSLDVEFQSLDL